MRRKQYQQWPFARNIRKISSRSFACQSIAYHCHPTTMPTPPRKPYKAMNNDEHVDAQFRGDFPPQPSLDSEGVRHPVRLSLSVVAMALD
jgi:hypothetical protein